MLTMFQHISTSSKLHRQSLNVLRCLKTSNKSLETSWNLVSRDTSSRCPDVSQDMSLDMSQDVTRHMITHLEMSQDISWDILNVDVLKIIKTSSSMSWDLLGQSWNIDCKILRHLLPRIMGSSNFMLNISNWWLIYFHSPFTTFECYGSFSL